MKLAVKNGVTSLILRLKILDTSVTTGAGKTGLSHSSSGLIISTIADNEATATAYTQAASNVETITTLGTFAAPTSGKCRFKEVDATNHPGIYEIQIANARWAVSNTRSVIVSVSGVSGAAQVDAEIQLDPVPANVEKFGDSAGTFSGGRPEVNVTHAAGVAWGSGAVTANSIADSAFVAAKFDTACLTAAKFAAGAISSTVLADGAITNAKFAAGAVDNAAIATDAIGAAEISAAAANKLADHNRRRTQANVEASSDGDALSIGSLYGLIQQGQESNTVDNVGFLTVYKTDGSTELSQRPITSNAIAEPVTGIS